MNKKHVVIIGGGISGLSTAYFLSGRASRENLPCKITILEASQRFGGVLRTLLCDGVPVETCADAFYAGAGDATNLCHELGLQDELGEAAPCFRRFLILKNKKCLPVGGPQDSFFAAARFWAGPSLSFFSKCRMLGEPFIPRRKENGDESAARFFRRRLGQGFFREIAEPVIRGVYMADPARLSTEAVLPRLRRAEKEFGSLAGSFLRRTGRSKKNGAEFLTLKNGLEGLTRALVRQLGKCELRHSAPVRQCVRGAGWEILLESGEKIRADAVCLAMNACETAQLISRTAPELSRKLSAIRYDPVAVVNLIYGREDIPLQDLDPGFLVPASGERCSFSSLKLFSTTHPNGEALLCFKAFISGTLLPEVYHEDDETLKQKILASVAELFRVRAVPKFANVERYSRALPQYETGHLERVGHIEEDLRRHPGLYVTGNGFHGFGITDCIREARINASKI